MSGTGPLVVVGDALLDRDVDGTADRVCPEAPALVLTEHANAGRPGGAGLAAALAAAERADVVLVTGMAADPASAQLRAALADAGVTVQPLPVPGTTAEKIRLRSDGRLLLRLDRGGAGEPPDRLSPPAAAAIRDAAAVLVSDYGRGLTRNPRIRAALAATGAPVVWDPHPLGAPAVSGTRLLTPNEPELASVTGRELPDRGERGQWLAAVGASAQELRRRWRTGAVAVTLGADGALLCHAGPTPLVVPAPSAVGDSCGAGDRFAAAATRALAEGALVSEAVEAAVAAASAYVTGQAPVHAGVTAATRGDTDTGRTEPGTDAPAAHGGDAVEAGVLVRRVRERGGTVVATGGCFDLLHAGHLSTLETARSLGDCLVVCINSDASVSRLKGADRPLTPQQDRVRILAALGCVDAVVVFDEPTPEPVLSWLRPDVWVKGGDYTDGTPSDPDLPEAEPVRGWGGQTVIVPYLDGRSTTHMIAAARAGASRPADGGRSSAPSDHRTRT